MRSGDTRFDVVVLGAGPAGCAAALALRRRGVEAVLLVAGDRPISGIGESIPPDTGLLLRQLGLWQGFVAAAHEPCPGSVSCWGSAAVGYNDFLFNVHGHGWHLDRCRFDEQLISAARDAGAQVRRGLRFDRVARRDGDGVGIRLQGASGADLVHTRFVIDATGSGARFARMMGARRIFHDRLTCVIGFLDLPAPARTTRMTMLEATPYGWWYAARIAETRLVAVLASEAELARAGDFWSSLTWIRLLRATSVIAAELEGPAAHPEQLIVRVAPSGVLDPACGDRWAAAGDAASSYDPISSQGIHKALQGGIAAADQAASALSGGDPRERDYTASVHAAFAAYLGNRNYFYALERRWPASAFWRRRQARTGLAPIPPPPRPVASTPHRFSPDRQPAAVLGQG